MLSQKIDGEQFRSSFESIIKNYIFMDSLEDILSVLTERDILMPNYFLYGYVLRNETYYSLMVHILFHIL